MGRLICVVVADHVVGKHNEALHREIDAAAGNGNELLIFESAICPMAMRRHDAGKAPFSPAGAIKVPAKIKPGKSLEQHLFYRVTRAVQSTGDLYMERSLFRHGQQSRARQNLFAEEGCPLLPSFRARKNGHTEVRLGTV